MMQDDRTNGQALAGLFDINNHMRDQFAADPAAPMKQAAPSPEPAQPQAPMSVMDQMDQRHGKFKNRMGLLSHAFSGGNASEYGDDDLRLAHKQQTLRGQLGDFDMDNMSMSDVVALSQLSPEMGKYAMEQYQFGRRVDDIGRAQGFMNDGVEDENDLWAQQTFGRYGLTPGGEQTSMTETLARAKMTQAEFDALPTESQRRVLYQHGTEEDRRAADRVAGRKTLAQLEDEAQATQQGDAIGKIDGSSIEYMHNASSIDFDQSKAMENADAIISMLENDELNTGKWQQWFKDATGVTTRADGTLGAAATENLIKQINSATFGALSEKEIEQLMQTFAQGGQSKEFNLGTMDMVKKKLQTAQEKHTRDTQRAVDRIKDNNPEEYERFMRDDDNYLRYGGGKDVKAVAMSGGGEMSYEQFYRDGIAQGKSRDEIDVGFNSLGKREEEAAKERERIAAEQAKLAEQARQEMQARGEHLSPYIRRQ